ncbi:MAG: tetratricopeptide repeat protein [Magnetospirillum sp.]|nr:tetratricopeptide repeat protein [Magnetospirillum sp.]
MRSDPAPLLDHAQALHNRGGTEEAEALYRRLITDFPKTAEAAKALTNLGVIRHQQGKLDEALDLHARALALSPDLAEARCNRGDSFSDMGRLEEAEADFAAAARLAPGLAPAWFNRGNMLMRLGRPAEAEPCYRRARDLLPHLAVVPALLATALIEQGRGGDAIDAMRAAVELAPDDWQLRSDLGALLQQEGQIAAAKESLRTAIALRPSYAPAHYNLGNAYYGEGLAAEAAACYRQALEINPRLIQAACNYLNCLHYLPGLDGAEIARIHRRVVGRWPQAPLVCHSNGRDAGRALRIGYVSSDFIRHPIGLLMRPVLTHHERSKVFVACYHLRHQSDAVTAELKAATDLWREAAHLDDEALERLIRSDAIDILIDLDGHTAGNRLTLFARKPAPLQVSWLGYPFTTGLAIMDYVLMDRATVPETAEAWFSERVAILPVSRLCYQGPATPEPAPPPVLTKGFITFGSFNNIAKLSPAVIDAWADILNRVPSSRLLLKWPHLAQTESADRLLAAFADQGIEPGRIELRGNSPPEELMAEYGDLDIALDPFPYCGAFTSCEALWMGVPVVTWPGKRPFSRQTLALLTSIGLDRELACADLDAYKERAVALAADPHRLSQWRRELRPAMARTIGDAVAHVTALEDFYRRIWSEWCAAP